jgi:hypothetical protein
MVVLFIVVLLTGDSVNAQQSTTTGKQTLNVLFIGNSYTARHNLSDVVKAMAEERNPNLTFNPTTVIYGGRTLSDHWAMGTQNIVSLHSLTKAQQESTVAALEKALGKDPDNRHAKTALTRHQKLLKQFESGEFERTKWDWVVLQSYRDDLEGDKSLYARFAPKFTELAKAQGAHVLLYETTPTTQNAEPLTALPDAAPVKQKANEIAALADRIGASVAPISQIAHRCQSQRPDLTLRFVNDAHLNQTLAYLTACTIYAAIFERSPEGLTVTSVTDIRFLNNDRKSQKDRDGKPITTTFSGKDRADLQRIAWEGYVAFKKLRSRKLP